MTRVAVVGHVEWVEFVHVPHVPVPGEIVQAKRSWEEAGGGGAVAALQLRALAGEATLYTALGDDELGRRSKAELEENGVQVVTVWRDEPQRRAVTFVDDAGERTITLIGPKLTPRGDDPLPWHELDETDAVYFTARDAGALRAARRARQLVATARELPTLVEARMLVDVLVHSGSDPGEIYRGHELEPKPGTIVTTAGADGGLVSVAGRRPQSYPAVPLPGPVVDVYGAGDCFAAALTYGVGAGLALPKALELAARCGAAATTGPGVHVGVTAADA